MCAASTCAAWSWRRDSSIAAGTSAVGAHAAVTLGDADQLLEEVAGQPDDRAGPGEEASRPTSRCSAPRRKAFRPSPHVRTAARDHDRPGQPPGDGLQAGRRGRLRACRSSPRLGRRRPCRAHSATFWCLAIIRIFVPTGRDPVIRGRSCRCEVSPFQAPRLPVQPSSALRTRAPALPSHAPAHHGARRPRAFALSAYDRAHVPVCISRSYPGP
jgi:hypothetical protein